MEYIYVIILNAVLKNTFDCSTFEFGFLKLTQLSGLYFIYLAPDRLCDIDDIIQDTTGGCIGYTLVFIAMKLLISRWR